MNWFTAELETIPEDEDLRLVFSRLVGCSIDDVAVVDDDFPPIDSKPVCIAKFPRSGGEFLVMISAYLFDPYQSTMRARSTPEVSSLLARQLGLRVLVPNEETIDPYSFIQSDGAGDSAVVDVDRELMDDNEQIVINRISSKGPIVHLDQAALVSLMVDNGICLPSEIVGCSVDEIESIERVIGSLLPRQYREFLLAMGHGAGALMSTELAFRQQAEKLFRHLIDLAADFPEIQPLVDTAGSSKGIFPISLTANGGFRFFNVGVSDDPIVYEWDKRMQWPRPAWASISAFLIGRARECFIRGDADLP